MWQAHMIILVTKHRSLPQHILACEAGTSPVRKDLLYGLNVFECLEAIA